MFKRSIISSISVLLCVHFCGGQNFEALEGQINTLIQDGKVPSMVVAVLKEGELIYENAFGYADLENKRESTIHTPYQLASLSKPITATAIMKLNQQGIINIDDPITKYVPLIKVEGSFKDPIIRQVLNHTAGLGTYFDIFYMDETLSPTSFEKAWEKYGILFHEPGRVNEYSNLGYGLLDHMISKSTSKTFGEYLKTELFVPLGMKNSFLIEQNAKGNQELAKKYDANMNSLPDVWNNTAGAGNIAASIHDIMRFASFHLQSLNLNLLDASSIHAMQKYKEPNALFHYYQDTYYSLGWYVMPDDNGQYVVWHEGGMMGASTTLKLYPKENIAIAIMTNTYSPAICRSLADSMASMMIPNYSPTPLNEIAEYQSVSSNPAMLGTWKGMIYVEDKEVPITLIISDEAIRISYIDEGFRSFFTDDQPLPYTSNLLFGVVNQNYFIGTGVGELPASDTRKEYQHLLSFKLFEENGKLRGTIVSMAAAQREYYAHPFYMELEKINIETK